MNANFRTFGIGAAGLVLGVALIGGAAHVAGAFDGGPGGPHGCGPRLHGPMGHGMPLFSAIARLGLGDTEKQKLHETLMGHRDEFHAAMRAIGDAHQAMRAAVEASAYSEDAIRAAGAKLADAETAAAILHAQALRDVRAALTEEQRTKLDAILAEQRHEMASRVHGMPPGGDPEPGAPDAPGN